MQPAPTILTTSIALFFRAEKKKSGQYETIGVVFTLEGLFHQLVHDMESALAHDSGLRIVPVNMDFS